MNQDSGQNFLQRNFFLVLCALLCLPLFFINIKTSHDWGDDFAQYILQAKNIVEHKPQIQTGYVYDVHQPVIAPPAYPAGFPLMLSAVYAWKGNSIMAFNYLITLLLFFLCLAMFWFFRKHFSELTALFLVLIFAYNPWTLTFKTEILSDFPYTLFYLLTTILYLYGRKSKLTLVLTGISAGIMLSIRGVASVFLIAIILHQLYLFFSEKISRNSKSFFMKTLLIFGSVIVTYLLLNIVLVNVPTGKFLEFYSHAYAKNSVGEIIVQNLNYYVDVFGGYFDPQLEKWFFITFISKSFSLALLLIGMLYSLIHKRSFIDLLVWIYFLLFIIYPYSAGGFRFILPVFPFLLYYMVTGLKQIDMGIRANRKILITAGGLFVLLQYQHVISKIIALQSVTVQGPQEATSIEAFNYIKLNIPENSIILFKKPKALALYSGRKTASTVYYQTPVDVKNMLHGLGAEYLLLNHDNDPDLGDEPMKKYIDEFRNEIEMIWQNDKFFLYRNLQH